MMIDLQAHIFGKIIQEIPLFERDFSKIDNIEGRAAIVKEDDIEMLWILIRHTYSKYGDSALYSSKFSCRSIPEESRVWLAQVVADSLANSVVRSHNTTLNHVREHVGYVQSLIVPPRK